MDLCQPPDGLILKKVADDVDAYGVFSLKKFKVGEVFGPYKGKRVEKSSITNGEDTGYMWEVCYVEFLYKSFLN